MCQRGSVNPTTNAGDVRDNPYHHRPRHRKETNPVLVDEQGGLLAGHGRLLAARKLGLAEVPVIRFEHLSEAQKRAYILADNQIALQAGWDDALLADELAWLRDERFDFDLIGFDTTELERLLALADGMQDRPKLKMTSQSHRLIRSANRATSGS
jgi:ParB-like chromosome segregation protein Spo0J